VEYRDVIGVQAERGIGRASLAGVIITGVLPPKLIPRRVISVALYQDMIMAFCSLLLCLTLLWFIHGSEHDKDLLSMAQIRTS
jgi:hypothetical protein